MKKAQLLETILDKIVDEGTHRNEEILNQQVWKNLIDKYNG